MSSDDQKKEALIDGIARKMKFLGTYDRFFNEQELRGLTIKQLQDRDFLLDVSVKAHSNPLRKKVLEAAAKGKLDPRWVPHVEWLKSHTRHKKTFWRKLAFWNFVKHVASSDILLNYTSALLYISYLTATDAGPNIDAYHDRIGKMFRHMKAANLLKRAPMAYTYWEGFYIKVITQVCKHSYDKPYEKELHPKLMRETLKMDKEKEREEIPPPRMVKTLFGGLEQYRATSLHEYGKRYFEILRDDNFPIY